MNMRVVLALLLLITSFVRGDDAAKPAGAGTPVSIPILNPSFEQPPAPTQGNPLPPANWTTSDPVDFVGYTGYVRASESVFAKAPDGDQFVELNATNKANPVGFSLSQTTSYVAALGDTFSLSVDTVSMSGGNTAGDFALVLNGSPVATNTGTGTGTPIPSSLAYTFQDQTVTYTVTDPKLVGATVGVQLITSYGKQNVYDNVRLTVTHADGTASAAAPAVAPAKAPASPESRKGFRIFSCGHSYHFLNYSFPILLREIAWSGGFPDHEPVGQSVIFGSKIIQHWDVKDEDNAAKKALVAGDVDVLTLAPLYLPDDGIEKFAQLGFDHNPNIRVTVQEFWLPFDANNRHHFDPPAEPRPATVDHNAATLDQLNAMHKSYFEGMDELVHGINDKLGKQVVFVVPVGQAVIALRGKVIAGQVPGVKTQEELFTDMLGHPGPVIQALIGYSHYAVIYKKNPVGLPVPTVLKLSKISPGDLDALNHLLEELAWDAVTHHPLSGVKP